MLLKELDIIQLQRCVGMFTLKSWHVSVDFYAASSQLCEYLISTHDNDDRDRRLLSRSLPRTSHRAGRFPTKNPFSFTFIFTIWKTVAVYQWIQQQILTWAIQVWLMLRPIPDRS